MKNYCLLLGIICTLISLNPVVPTLHINEADLKPIIIYQMRMNTFIHHRLARTDVTTKVQNIGHTTEREIFSVILPNGAFVTDFRMEIEGQNYTSYILDNDEARKQFDSALEDGLPGGYVAPSAQDSNVFLVYINMKHASKASFLLTYEELLKRKNGRFEHITNIYPGKLVRDLCVEVFISENSKIINLEVLPFRSGTQMASGNVNLVPKSAMVTDEDRFKGLRYYSSIREQKELARFMNTPEGNGLAAQFVVQYDLERDSNAGNMITKNEYFLNFFAPSGFEPISKHIVFVLDTSASMEGNKMEQLKEAMGQILDQLDVTDLFNLVTFDNGAKVWNLDNQTNNVLHFVDYNQKVQFNEPMQNFPNAYPASPKYIATAKHCVNQFVPSGGTDALAALDAGLRLVEIDAKGKVDSIYRHPVIVFLTDGYPNTDPETVITKITELNKDLKRSSINSILLGEDGNLDFLQKLSLLNNGIAKHIYDSVDSAKQLVKFYDEIASPILLNISVNYDRSRCPNITKTEFSALYSGSEILVAGECVDSEAVHTPEINAISFNGAVKLRPSIEYWLNDMSRNWAHATVKELLDKRKTSNGNTDAIDKKIVELSLNYSLLTGISSMVVSKQHNKVVIGSRELQMPLGSHPTASTPNPNYARPTSTTTAATLSTTPSPTTAATPSTTPSPTTSATPSTTPSPSVGSQMKALFEAIPWLQKLLKESADQFKLPGSHKLDSNKTSVSNVFEFSIQAKMSAIQTLE